MIVEIVLNSIIVILIAVYFNKRGKLARKQIKQWAEKDGYILKSVRFNFFGSNSGFIKKMLYDVKYHNKTTNDNYLIGLEVGGLFWGEILYDEFKIEYIVNLNDLYGKDYKISDE